MEDKKMNEILTKENIKIEDMIFEVRGKQVILSSNVAKLYKTETRIINQTIKRNIMRFPETFCFQLTAEEIKNLTSQFVISSSLFPHQLVENKMYLEIYLYYV